MRRSKDCDRRRRLSLRSRGPEPQVILQLRRWSRRPSNFTELRTRTRSRPGWQQIGSANFSSGSRTCWSRDEVNILKTTLSVWPPWKLREVTEGREGAKGGWASLDLSGTSGELWECASRGRSTASRLLLLSQLIFCLSLPLLLEFLLELAFALTLLSCLSCLLLFLLFPLKLLFFLSSQSLFGFFLPLELQLLPFTLALPLCLLLLLSLSLLPCLSCQLLLDPLLLKLLLLLFQPLPLLLFLDSPGLLCLCYLPLLFLLCPLLC